MVGRRERIGRDVRRAMAEPTDVAGRSLPMSISMGLALYPDHGIDADVLAWYRALGTGWQTRMNAALRKAAGL